MRFLSVGPKEFPGGLWLRGKIVRRHYPTVFAGVKSSRLIET
jgi:hypothetical protein